MVETFIKEWMEQGEIPSTIPIYKAKGHHFKTHLFWKDYVFLVFDTNECVVGKVNTENLFEFVEDAFEEFYHWDWYAYVKLFIEDDDLLETCRQVIQSSIEKETKERQYKMYLELKEQFENREEEK